MGLTAALRVGSVDAMNIVINELNVLRSEPRFGLILFTIGNYPKNQSWLPSLQQLIALHTDVPGLDAAIVGALRKIGTKAIVPMMAELLDSKDPQAQRAVASYFGMFTLLGNADGEIFDSAPIGPFATEDIRAFTPRPESGMTATQYTDFWKTWWSQKPGKSRFRAALAPTGNRSNQNIFPTPSITFGQSTLTPNITHELIVERWRFL